MVWFLQVEISRVATLCKLLESLLCGDTSKVDWKTEPSKLHPLVCTTFVFCYVWSIGGNLTEKSVEGFDSFARDLFSETHDVKVWGFTVWTRKRLLYWTLFALAKFLPNVLYMHYKIHTVIRFLLIKCHLVSVISCRTFHCQVYKYMHVDHTAWS